MKKILAIILALTLCLSVSAVFAEKVTSPIQKDVPTNDGNIQVFVNGSFIKSDVPAQIVDGRTLLPVRAIFEAFGLSVSWNPESQTVKGISYDSTITMRIGENSIKYFDTTYVTGSTEFTEFTADVPAQIIDGRTLVPVRALAETLNSDVQWIAEERKVVIEEKINTVKTADGGIKLDGNSMRLIGRYYEKMGVMQSSFTASGIELRFRGTEAKIKLKVEGQEDAYFHVFIDGDETVYTDHTEDNRMKAAPGESTVTLAENLPDGIHTIKILKSNEELRNKIGWVAFYTDGELLAPPAKRERQIQVHGDSITCAYNNMNFADNDDKKYYGSLYQDGVMSYAAFLARDYNADLEVFAQSGYSVNASIGKGTVAYDKVSITNPGMGDWDHNINHPDLIIQFNWINDYHGVYKAGNTTMDKMEENYYNLVWHMLSVHPSAKLIIISHETIPDFNEMLDKVLEKYATVGDASRIRVLKSTKSYARHPFASYQKEIAEELKPLVSELMGW